MLPKKKAWGCPCCLRWFESRDSWTKHGANHAVQNDQVVGWSLSTMVQSLLFQPFLAEAIARSPLQVSDTTKAKADVCQNLREALERHQLPDAVQTHYDYRYLQMPEALALYAYRLVTYGEPFLDDVSVATTKADIVENAVDQLHNRYNQQPFAPTGTSVTVPPAAGYWNPEDPFSYSPHACQPVAPGIVLDRLTGDMSALPSSGDGGTTRSCASTGHPSSPASVPMYAETLQAVSAAASNELVLPPPLFDSPARTLQEPSGADRGHGGALSVKKSLQNLVHRPSFSKSSASRPDPIPPVPALPDCKASDRCRTAPMVDYHRESTRVEALDILASSPSQARLSGRMSGIEWNTWVTWQPDEQHDP